MSLPLQLQDYLNASDYDNHRRIRQQLIDSSDELVSVVYVAEQHETNLLRRLLLQILLNFLYDQYPDYTFASLFEEIQPSGKRTPQSVEKQKSTSQQCPKINQTLIG